jgi:putative transposase
MVIKIPGKRSVETLAIYNILGVDIEGKKYVLCLYISEDEDSKFWLSVLNDLKVRGMKDIIINYIDGLKGFQETVEAVFPKTRLQLCIGDQIPLFNPL